MSAATASRPAATPLKLTWPRVLRSEWTKLWSLRSSVYTLLTSAVVMTGFGLIFAAAAQTASPSRSGPSGALDPATASLGGVYLAQLVIAVLGVLLISGEYSTGSIRSTLAAVPARLPVLWAKGVVLTAVTLVLMAAAAVAAFLSGQAILSGKHLQTSLSDPGVLRAVLGAALYLTVVALLGLGLGALLRHTAAAIGIAAGLLLVLPILSGL
nr:ABC transporter permease subunit [Actinomycetota bacterium]